MAGNRNLDCGLVAGAGIGYNRIAFEIVLEQEIALPNTKFAKKRVRQSTKRRLRHRIDKSEVRTQVKKLQKLVAAGDKQAAAAELKTVTRLLDKVASKGVIPKNRASRSKARLSHLVATGGVKA